MAITLICPSNSGRGETEMDAFQTCCTRRGDLLAAPAPNLLRMAIEPSFSGGRICDPTREFGPPDRCVRVGQRKSLQVTNVPASLMQRRIDPSAWTVVYTISCVLSSSAVLEVRSRKVESKHARMGANMDIREHPSEGTQ
ncbi:hypothetical protein [Burkholderia ubonensis]|uniref:hypothetical protein n=1 Tax=Burkholderia ubonensis TaxID=101571 RepID=UPI0012F84A4C|nr:hypothetical protein [Burkholderia ubonensis]